MKSIDKNIINEINIKHSRFICHLYRINDTDEAKKIINETKQKYKDATHNCYAYICSPYKKMSDDGEPSGTAGMPILNILEAYKLDRTLAIVTRYFGGIKLGANGLIRAYADSVKLAIDKSNIITLEQGIKIKIEFNYNNLKQIDYLTKDYEIINKEYQDNIFYTLLIPINDSIKDKLINYIINYDELEKTLIIEKKD